MRLRIKLHRLFAYLHSIIINPLMYKYSLLSVSENAAVVPSNLRNRLFLFFSLNVFFFFGLFLSVLLLCIQSSMTVWFSFFPLFMAIVFFFHVIENSMVYARHEPPYSRLLCEIPENYNFRFWEHIELFPEGKYGPRITGFLIFNDDFVRRSTCPTILVLHGNAGNVGHRLPMCRLLADNVQCNILLIDYRGFGRSSGTPSESGLYSDAHAGLRYLLGRTDIAADKIFLFGRSIGGAVAIQLATNSANVPLRGVIIENSFTSLPEAAQHIFSASFGSLLRYVMPSWAFINKYPSLERLQSCGFVYQETRAPKFLFLSGDADDLIPPKMMKNLANAYRQSVCHEPSNPSFPEPVSPSDFMKNGVDGLVTFCGGRHNDTWLCSNWGDVICHFIRQSCGSHLVSN